MQAEVDDHVMPPLPSHHHIEELQLINASLLPGEAIVFLEDAETYSKLVDLGDPSLLTPETPLSEPHFQLTLPDSSSCWLEVLLPMEYPATDPDISVKGLKRSEQELWSGIIADCMSEADSAAGFVAYDAISQLLPRLKEYLSESTTVNETTSFNEAQTIPMNLSTATNELFHVLFTSHHLVSPTKRRNLQSWSSSLHLQGFAKVGYPGLIYAQGDKEQIEEFVSNVKAMQWLALRLRFLEPIPTAQDLGHMEHWREFQKVGEVVEEMRRLGREQYVVELGIGSRGGGK